MTKSFKVAGHVFSVEFSDNSPIWTRLEQYDPFLCGNVENPLFRFRMTDALPEGERTLVFDAPVEDGQTVIRLYRQGGYFVFDMSPEQHIPICAHLITTEDFRSGMLKMESRRASDVMFAVNNSLMLLYAFCTSTLDTLEMHASVIVNGGKSYLFLGKSGTGKSTHSSLWLKHIEGSVLMNDDNPIVRVLEDGTVMAYGSPWSGKTPCYKNMEAPVGAFVRIRQCPENRIEQLGIVESYANLYSSSSGLKTDREMADGLHRTMEKIALGVPFYLLDCRPDKEAAELSFKTVKGL